MAVDLKSVLGQHEQIDTLFGRPTDSTGNVNGGATYLNTFTFEETAIETAYNTWKTLKSVSGFPGIIEFFSIFQVANSGNRDTQFRFSIDGVIQWTSATDFLGGISDDDRGICLVGALSGTSTLYGVATGKVPFNNSFLIEFINTEQADTIEMGCRVLYYSTG